MSRIDPECFPRPSYKGERVCTACIEDSDLKRFIKNQSGPRGCSYCGRRDAPTAFLCDVAELIGERMRTFYGKAVEQLPYESREGGYQGWHTDTEDLLFDTIGLGLPRDTNSRLRRALVNEIGDDIWCEFDWLRLDFDKSFQFDWRRFCETVKHERRFFFHQTGGGGRYNSDDRSLAQFLNDLGELIDELALIKTQSAGYVLYRARARKPGIRYQTADDLGPPPAQYATQSNRMNPPGIPMFYGADRKALACTEARYPLLSVGRFVAERPLRLLDFAAMPPIPGFFSTATRNARLGLSFLHSFAKIISEPVPGDDRTHIEYIPTQVFTEFLRDFPFAEGPLDGVRYRSATGAIGANVVLFATQSNLASSQTPGPDQWLRLQKATQIEISTF